MHINHFRHDRYFPTKAGRADAQRRANELAQAESVLEEPDDSCDEELVEQYKVLIAARLQETE